MSAFGQHAETEIRLNALSARITQLEALIREVAIPALDGLDEFSDVVAQLQEAVK